MQLLTPESPEVLRSAFQQATAWQAIRPFLPRTAYALICRRHDGHAVLQQLCVDPAPLIQLALARFRSVQAFSATLPGLTAMQDEQTQRDAALQQPSTALGLPLPLQAFKVPAIFASSNMAALVVCDIDVRFRARHGSLAKLSACIRSTVAARAGNYLVFLPSYAYLSALFDDFTGGAVGTPCHGVSEVFAQTAGFDDAARAAFLERFRPDGQSRVGFAVTGGLFSESVDLPGSALIGVIIVGVSLPPPSLARELLREHLQRQGDALADAAAYDIPAMVRVRQTAGRLIRSASDRGVLVLVDVRFNQQRFRRWLPDSWALQALNAEQLPTRLAAFWQRPPVDVRA